MHHLNMQPSGTAEARLVLFTPWLPIGMGTIQPENVLEPAR
jgi:hypothetical protein